jgi:ketosteroid isomerase-like protein
MSQVNVEIVRGIYAAYGRRDNHAPFEVYAPDIEWDISELGLLGVENVYHGHDGVRDCFRDLFSSFREFELAPLELLDASEHVLATVSEHAVGAASGVDVDREHYAAWTLLAGKVARMRVFIDRADAFKAVGLSE